MAHYLGCKWLFVAEAERIPPPPEHKNRTKLRKGGASTLPAFFSLELESHKITFLTTILCHPVIFILVETSFMLSSVSKCPILQW